MNTKLKQGDKTMYANLYEKIVKGEEKISLVGLGYVGMPIAVADRKSTRLNSSHVF